MMDALGAGLGRVAGNEEHEVGEAAGRGQQVRPEGEVVGVRLGPGRSQEREHAGQGQGAQAQSRARKAVGGVTRMLRSLVENWEWTTEEQNGRGRNGHQG